MARGGGGGGAAEEEEEEEEMAVSETLTADSVDEERRRGSSSSASSVAASSDSYCTPDEWQQVAIKTCVTDDAKPNKAKPATGEKKPPPAGDACAERHRAPGAYNKQNPHFNFETSIQTQHRSGTSSLVDRAAG
jgi:hypothetical protein